MKIKTALCPTCGKEWPFPVVESPHREADIDWTCNVCLHAIIARLQRVIAAYDGRRQD